MKCKCGKIAYQTKELAYQNLLECKGKGRNELSIYKCNRLNCWHLTSQNSDDIGRPLPITVPINQKKIKPIIKLAGKLDDKNLAEIVFVNYGAEKCKYLISTWI